MIAVIAEKPSLARNIVAGIGTMQKKNGYYENNEYIVTWAFGHLFSLCDVEQYTGEVCGGKWNLKNLPCFPETFRFRLRDGDDGKEDQGVKKQFEIIESLLNRNDVDKIVNAGDSDREGEIIVRLCIKNGLKSDKPLYRLWLPDQTPKTVAKALSEMKEESAYDNLANEGFARTYTDWLYGVNLTRYATLKAGVLLRVGRVIVPIVKAVYDRDTAIKNFKPETYYSIFSSCLTKGETVELTSKTKFGKNELNKAKKFCEEYNTLKAVVADKKIKKDIIGAGKLYSLSKLQNALGKKYKMPMETSLACVQKLYESGYVTYPRTDSEYLAENEKDKIKELIGVIAKIGYSVIFKDKKTIFDNSKIEAHSALTPTYKIPDKNSLTENELNVYQTIFRRFAAVFCSKDCKAEKTEITIDLGGKESFVLNGTVITEEGWMKYDYAPQKDKLLPNLNVGEAVNTSFSPVEKETNPPKHYTIETLNNYLKNPFREDKAEARDGDDDAEDYKAVFEGLELGTEATRTGIIDNAKKSKYIALTKDVYTILPGGEFLIGQLSDMGISMDKYKTSELGKALKKVYHQLITVDGAVKLAEDEISTVFTSDNKESPNFTGFYGDEIGLCPICGKKILRGRYSYGCSGYKEGCKFRINLKILGKIITVKNASELLNNGKTTLIKGFISKSGKPFDAALRLENSGNIVFDFTKQ